VKTERKHLFQHGGRRLNVKNVRLYGPGAESICFDPVLNSDGYILVPRYFPICVWNLIEKNSAHWIAFSSKYGLNQTADCWRVGKLPYFTALFEQIANSEDTNPPPDASSLVEPLDGGYDFFDLGCRNNGLTRGEAVLLDLIANQGSSKHVVILIALCVIADYRPPVQTGLAGFPVTGDGLNEVSR
jgi:hypothetical protein